MLRKTTHGLLAARALLVAMPAGAQTLRFGLAEDPDALDPALGRTFVGRIVFSALCDKLVDISPDLKVVPQLATLGAGRRLDQDRQIGRASCRERVCQSV